MSVPILSGRVKRGSYSITVTPGAGVTTAVAQEQALGATGLSNQVTLNGILREIIITPPSAVDASATITVSLADADGNVVYSKGSLAANSGASINLLTNDQRVPLSGLYTLQVTYSAAQPTTASTTKVVMYIET